jgi:hypothetical protein
MSGLQVATALTMLGKGGTEMEDVTNMKRKVHIKLRLPLDERSPFWFLAQFAKGRDSANPTLPLAQYVLESALMHRSFLNLQPRELAAGAFYLARKMMNPSIVAWDELLHLSVAKEDARRVALQLNEMLRAPPVDVFAVQKKFEHS